MAGPSGFVQRFKGKVAFPAGGIFIGDVQMTPSGTDLNVNAGWGTVQTSTGTSPTAIQLSTGRAAGLDIIAPVASTAAGGTVYRMPPPFAGAVKVLQYSTLNGSSICFITLSTAGTVTVTGIGTTASTASFAGSGGSSLSNTIKSTQGCQIELIGVSSVAWLFTGVIPSTSGPLTFSTST